VERVLRLPPVLHGSENDDGGLVQTNGLGLSFVSGGEAVDGSLQFDDRCEDGAFEPLQGELGEQTIDCIDPEQEVGVKRKVSAPGDWQGVCGESPLR